MDYEPDYSSYTMADLLDACAHINREKYPENAKRLEEEIARRTGWGSEGNAPPSEFSLEFRGSAREYFRIWIVNLCLTLLTLGIFSAWAKVRKKRYLYSHTILDGTPFQYLGQPIPILKGRVIAGILLLGYYVSTHFVNSLFPYILGAGLIIGPLVIVRSAAFNARYSAFRNMTFHFDAGYMNGLKVLYAWGIIPAFAIGMMFKWPQQTIVLGITSALFGISYPWWIRRLKKFIIEHTSYGGRKGTFSATGGQFFKIYLIAGLIIVAVLIPTGIFVMTVFEFEKKSWRWGYLSAAPMYAGYVVAFAYIQSRSGNLVWNHSRLGPLRFKSTLRCLDLLKLYLTNALGIAVSLGLLIPWAVMRTMKYRADNMQVIQEGQLSEFQGSDLSTVSAFGAETAAFFDVDFSL